MINITKGKEPKEWSDKKATPGFTTYEPIPELRTALLQEQGYICAYCMRRIPVSKKDPGENETSKIEHLQSRDGHPSQQLDFNNMLICCPGRINGKAHCDKSKGDADISLSPLDPKVANSISYSTKKGEIKSSNPQWQRDIDEVLCLNNALLQANRAEALKGVLLSLSLKPRHWKQASALQSMIQVWQDKDAEGKRKPYCGIVIWFLEKKLHPQ